MALVYREKKFYCGRYMEVELYPVFESAKHRGKKRKPSSKVQEQLNRRHAESNLRRLLNTNFTDTDDKVDLTFKPSDDPEDIEDAKRVFRNFIRRVKRARAKKGLPDLKYIAVMEQKKRSKKIHFHMVMSGGLNQHEISKLWGKGLQNGSACL